VTAARRTPASPSAKRDVPVLMPPGFSRGGRLPPPHTLIPGLPPPPPGMEHLLTMPEGFHPPSKGGTKHVAQSNGRALGRGGVAAEHTPTSGELKRGEGRERRSKSVQQVQFQVDQEALPQRRAAAKGSRKAVHQNLPAVAAHSGPKAPDALSFFPQPSAGEINRLSVPPPFFGPGGVIPPHLLLFPPLMPSSWPAAPQPGALLPPPPPPFLIPSPLEAGGEAMHSPARHWVSQPLHGPPDANGPDPMPLFLFEGLPPHLVPTSGFAMPS